MFFPLHVFISTCRHIDFVSPEQLAKLTCNGGRRGLQNLSPMTLGLPRRLQSMLKPPRSAFWWREWEEYEGGKVRVKVCLSISCYTMPAYSILKVLHMPLLSSTAMTTRECRHSLLTSRKYNINILPLPP